MKIVLVSDLHGRQDWYAWLVKQASTYDVLAIAGDLLSLEEPLQPQVRFLVAWFEQFRLTGRLLFLCDGNHDQNASPLPFDPPAFQNLSQAEEKFYRLAYLSSHWMDGLLKIGAAVVSGVTKARDKLIVTSLFFEDFAKENEAFLEQGRQERREHPGSSWLVLNHAPPVGRLGDRYSGNPQMNELIEEYQPEFFICGHDHMAPFTSGSCFERIGRTRIFNPGHRPNRRRPCSVSLDLETGRFSWDR